MIDNVSMVITKGEKTIVYNGVVCSSIEEAASLIHPDYWKDIPVGMMMLLENGVKKLIRFSKDIMLIRVNGSRHFVQIEA